jgi:hypothetical protein
MEVVAKKAARKGQSGHGFGVEILWSGVNSLVRNRKDESQMDKRAPRTDAILADRQEGEDGRMKKEKWTDEAGRGQERESIKYAWAASS